MGRLGLIEQERGHVFRPPAVRRPLGGWEPAPFELVLSTLRMTLFRDPNALFPLGDQVGSNDLTLVNLHLAALSLPGGESASKNHGDSHRLASFAHTLQETLKGRTWSFPASAGSPAPAGEGRAASSRLPLVPAAGWLSTATLGEGAGHTPACSGARPRLGLRTSPSLGAENARSTVPSRGSSSMERMGVRDSQGPCAP